MSCLELYGCVPRVPWFGGRRRDDGEVVYGRPHKSTSPRERRALLSGGCTLPIPSVPLVNDNKCRKIKVSVLFQEVTPALPHV